MHQVDDLIYIFNDCFETTYNTRLMKGEHEPLYLPAHAHQPYHAIFFAHGFFSSALHECAHWLIAGAARRKQVDYGYWYAPDGRTVAQQQLFQRVEVKPQALEWILSDAALYPFHCSVDNLSGAEADTEAFKAAVYQHMLVYKQQQLWARAEQFRAALHCFYQAQVRPAIMTQCV